jgi:hypothetical protein
MAVCSIAAIAAMLFAFSTRDKKEQLRRALTVFMGPFVAAFTCFALQLYLMCVATPCGGSLSQQCGSAYRLAYAGISFFGFALAATLFLVGIARQIWLRNRTD